MDLFRCVIYLTCLDSKSMFPHPRDYFFYCLLYETSPSASLSLDVYDNVSVGLVFKIFILINVFVYLFNLKVPT